MKKIYFIVIIIFIILSISLYSIYNNKSNMKNVNISNKKSENKVIETYEENTDEIKNDDAVKVELKGEEKQSKVSFILDSKESNENEDKKEEINVDTKKSENYVVTFDSNKGECIVKEKVVTYNGKYNELPVCEKKGYTFLGWYTNNEEKIEENKIVNIRSNHTLYAYYKTNNYSIKYDYNYLIDNLYDNLNDKNSWNMDYEIILDDDIFKNQNVLKFNIKDENLKYKNDISLEVGQTYTYSVYLKSNVEQEMQIGYIDELESVNVTNEFKRFTKTFVAGDKDYSEFIFNLKDNSELEIYDLQISKGELNIKEENKEYDETIQDLLVPEREGYTFVGWMSSDTLKEEVKSIYVDSDKTYYAKWDVNTYTLELNLNGGTLFSNTKIDINYKNNAKLDIPSSNYKVTYDDESVDLIKRDFNGWLNESNELLKNDYKVLKNEKLKAVYENDIKIKLRNISKENYICTWNTNKDGSGTKYESESVITINSDINLYSNCEIFMKFQRPINNGAITSEYGNRIHPIQGIEKFHSGIDMVSSDKNIYPILSGKVAKTGNNSSMGNYIIIYHEFNNQKYTSAYYHLSEKKVRKGQSVDQNTIIGIMGQTGAATGVHLHLTMYKGYLDSGESSMVNPKDYINLPSKWDDKVY